MSPARLVVRAVVVSDGQSPRLAAVLDALTQQDPVPDSIDLVLVGGANPPEPPDHPDATLIRSAAPHFGSAVDAALAAHPAQPGEMLWILHDDSAPLPGALAALTATARKRGRAEVIGAVQVRWDDPSRLVSLGTTTTRTGARRVTLVDEDDVNQGQYDARDDVLAVSLAGALVRRDTWERLEGLDPAYDGWGDSLDFCRRVWRSGGDVVVVPQARVRHAQESLYARRGEHEGSRRDTYGARRAAEWFHALAYASWWAILPLLIAPFVSSAWRAVIRVVQNDARLLGADLAVPVRVLARLPRLRSSRALVTRTAGRGRRARAAEQALLATGRQVRHDIRVREWGDYETWRAASAPSDVARTELDHARRRRRQVWAGLMIAVTAVAALLHGAWLLAVVRGDMLVGDALGVTDVSVGDLWDRGLGGWTEQSLGAPSIDGGLAPLLLPLALVPGGLAVGIGLLLALAPLWAAMSAWGAVGAFTRSLWIRALTAGAYALMPAFLVSIDEGRLGAVMVHILLPVVALGVARGGGWHRGERLGDGEEYPAVRLPSSSAAMAGALALGGCVIAAPVLLIPAVFLLVVLGLLARGSRWRIMSMALPALVIGLPGLIAAVEQGIGTADAVSILAREPGPSAASDASVLDLLLDPFGTVGGVPAILAAASGAMVAVVLVAVAVAALGGRRWRAVTGGLVLMGLGVGIAAVSAATVVSPDAGAGTSAVNGWAGAGLSVVAVGAMVAAAAGLDSVTMVGRGWQRIVVRSGAALGTAVILVSVAGHALAVAWPPRDDASTVRATSRDVIPLVAALEEDQSTRARVLLVGESGDTVTATVVAGDGTEVISTAGELLADGRSAVRTDGLTVVGADVLAEATADLLGAVAGAGDALAEWGIGVVVAEPGADSVADSLAQAPDLTLLGSSDRGTSWRVNRAEGVPVSRAWVETDQGDVTPLDMGRSAGRGDVTAAGTLVVAAAADAAWTATLDGVELERVEDPLGRVAFAVPADGRVAVAFDDTSHRLWWWLGAAALAWAALGAIPLRTRTFKEVRV